MNNNYPAVYSRAVNCNLCGGYDYEVLRKYSNKNLLSPENAAINLSATIDFPNMVKCKHCGLAFVNPQWVFPDGVFPYTEKAEDAYFVKTLGSRRIAYHNLVISTVEKYCLPDVRSIDVGCGDGLILEESEKIGVSCDGYEISHSLVQKLKDKYGTARIFSGSLESISEKTYDIVYLINVIEHLYDPARMLSQIHRIIKPGGLIIIHAPNFGGLPAKFLGARWHQFDPFGHLYYFTRRTLTKLLLKTGFVFEDTFFLKSKSVMINVIQYTLDACQLVIGNGLGIIARRSF